jgi:hypothetical protein
MNRPEDDVWTFIYEARCGACKAKVYVFKRRERERYMCGRCPMSKEWTSERRK